jgi:4-hydroxythreonine-4-phosphate dehydrogenase
MERLSREESVEVSGPYPADTVFRRCISGDADLVVVPYHDVGLAVLKTLAPEAGINVTTGLPFPRTSPDHGTAFDIAGTGRADPRSMAAAIDACADFCRRIDAELKSP